MFDDVNLLPDGNGSRIDERKNEELLVIRTYLKKLVTDTCFHTACLSLELPTSNVNFE